MNEDLSQALLVLVVGMFTVFLILGLVVLTGRLLIQIVNRFAPLTVMELPKRKKRQPASSSSTSSSLSPSTLAAIVAAVQHLTDGKGRIEQIEEIDPPK
ncbi:MAG: OadG family protein [Bacteroidota bacterium]